MDSADTEIFCQDDFMLQSFIEFEDMRRNEKLVDFKISFKDRSFIGHRLVLAARIPYFRDVFCSLQEEVTLNEIDPDALESVINFAYNGKIKITSENVVSLLSASKALQLTGVYDTCWNFLEKNLNSNNVLESRRLAEEHRVSKFLDAADSYIRENFEELTNSESFLTLRFQQLKEIISRDDIKVSTEEKVFEAVMRWVKVSPSERKELLPELLSSVRMCLLTPDYLIEKVSIEEFVRSSLRCRDLVEEAKSYHLLPAKRSKFNGFQSRPRLYSVKSLGSRLRTQSLHNDGGNLSTCGTTPRSSLYSVCKRSDHATTKVKLFDRNKKTWFNKSSTPLCEYEFMEDAAILGVVIYIFTDVHVHTFNVRDSAWITKGLFGDVCGSRSVSHSGRIYFIGGCGDIESVAVRVFDPRNHKMLHESEMPRPLTYPGVTLVSSTREAPLEASIYITGGMTNTKFDAVNAVEIYKPDTKQWRKVSSMICGRYRHGCCNLNEKIYVFGGMQNALELLDSAEVYDPLTNQWNLIPSIPHKGIMASVSDENEEKILLAHEQGIEIYDPKSNEWKSTVKKRARFSGSQIFLVKSEVGCN